MYADLTKVKNIVFDLGKVLLNLDFDAILKSFQALGMKKEVIDNSQVYFHPVFYALETGAITPVEFRRQVREFIGNPELTDDQIDSAWSAIICDIPPQRVAMLQRLASDFRLFLFSNTNEIHMQKLYRWFRKTYGFEFNSLFEKDFYSHIINARKPDLNAYLKIIEIAGITPSETLFIDDLKKNIVGAQKAGMQTYWLQPGEEIAYVLGG